MWSIHQTWASVNVAGLSARVNLQQPEGGLLDVTWHGAPLGNSRLFQLRQPPLAASYDLSDAYVRGADLVALYRIPPREGLAVQVYWRFLEHADLGAAGFEWIVSVQTDQLDDDPCLSIGSELACGEVLQGTDSNATVFARVPLPERASDAPCRRAGTGVFLCRLSAGRGAYLEMVHPSDFCAAEFLRMSDSEHLLSSFALFEGRLEKGVLRRARISGLLLPPTRDAESTAGQCYRRWLASPAPLTA